MLLIIRHYITDLKNVYASPEVPAEKPFVKVKTAGSDCSFVLSLSYDTDSDVIMVMKMEITAHLRLP
jgi:hypothetical protein